MKKAAVILMGLFLALLLCACGGEAVASRQIQVSIVETGDFSVEENGQWIEPGGTVVFTVRTGEGVAITGAQYDGDYALSYGDGVVSLELQNVRYPQRVELELSTEVKTVIYESNGGGQEAVSRIYSTEVHLRPNTETDLFSRPGYTLIAWNTEPDGSGIRVGLGSRVTVEGHSLTLYAQWAQWTDTERFQYAVEETGVTILRYMGNDTVVAVPEEIDGLPVTAIASSAFVGVEAEELILPSSVKTVEDGAFKLCGFHTLTIFDNIESISDAAFESCYNFTTLRINAVEDPYGCQYRRESLLADKVDMLIAAQGQRKLICYGGCSMWYNLDGQMLQEAVGESYKVINMGLNGVVNSLVQMEILLEYMEPGDVLFHTPELYSREQLLLDTGMDDNDDKLWCGLEYNYDLLTCVDVSQIDGLFDSLCIYLDMKRTGGSYQDEYTDTQGRRYLDSTGSIPFERSEPAGSFGKDPTGLDPTYLENGLPLLGEYYERFRQKEISVFASYACVNLDGVPAEQQGNMARMDALFRAAVESGGCAVLVSDLEDYLFSQADMYDTHYHLLSEAARRNTENWIRDLLPYLDTE